MEKFKQIIVFIFASNRAYSFYWRAGLAFLLLFTGYITEILPGLSLGEGATIFVAYVLNEVTKYLNTEKQKYD